MSDLLSLGFKELARSNVDKRHPFRNCVLASINTNALFPEIRTVVKRHFNPSNSRISIYTDSRASKVEQVKSNPNVSLLFYHPKKKLQIRMQGTASIKEHSSELYKETLDKIAANPRALKDYTSNLAPGSFLEKDHELHYSNKIHFEIIEVDAFYIDILQLGKESHQRIACRKNNSSWYSEKLVP